MLINMGIWEREEKAKCMIMGVTGNVYRSQEEGCGVRKKRKTNTIAIHFRTKVKNREEGVKYV